jgi:hypothetical protein
MSGTAHRVGELLPRIHRPFSFRVGRSETLPKELTEALRAVNYSEDRGQSPPTRSPFQPTPRRPAPTALPRLA